MEENNKRVTIYVNEEEYRELRSCLAIEAVTFSEWVRNHIKELIKEYK